MQKMRQRELGRKDALTGAFKLAERPSGNACDDFRRNSPFTRQSWFLV